MRVSTLATVVLLAAVTVSSCDSVVYIAPEIEAQKLFGSIEAGSSRESVVAALGAPDEVLTPLHSHFALESRDGSTMQLTIGDRNEWPDPIRFLPDRPVTGEVLVYIDGTVAAFYFIDVHDHVEHVSVFTS
jgi:hypothetical protein